MPRHVVPWQKADLKLCQIKSSICWETTEGRNTRMWSRKKLLDAAVLTDTPLLGAGEKVTARFGTEDNSQERLTYCPVKVNIKLISYTWQWLFIFHHELHISAWRNKNYIKFKIFWVISFFFLKPISWAKSEPRHFVFIRDLSKHIGI